MVDLSIAMLVHQWVYCRRGEWACQKSRFPTALQLRFSIEPYWAILSRKVWLFNNAKRIQEGYYKSSEMKWMLISWDVLCLKSLRSLGCTSHGTSSGLHQVPKSPGGRSFCPAIWLMENEVQTDAETKRGKWWTNAWEGWEGEQY